MAYRFIDAADWQIVKPFGNIPGDAGVERRPQPIPTVNRIADTMQGKAVDAVLVAGDAFDSDEVRLERSPERSRRRSHSREPGYPCPAITARL